MVNLRDFNLDFLKYFVKFFINGSFKGIIDKLFKDR